MTNHGSATPTKFGVTSPEAIGTAKPPEKRPWHKRPWVKKALEVGFIELVKGVIKALIRLTLGRQRQPTEAAQT